MAEIRALDWVAEIGNRIAQGDRTVARIDGNPLVALYLKDWWTSFYPETFELVCRPQKSDADFLRWVTQNTPQISVVQFLERNFSGELPTDDKQLRASLGAAIEIWAGKDTDEQELHKFLLDWVPRLWRDIRARRRDVAKLLGRSLIENAAPDASGAPRGSAVRRCGGSDAEEG